MATPRGHGPPASLLFTPATSRPADGQRTTDFRSISRGRSPNATPLGRPGRMFSRELTPPSRRRSVTPVGTLGSRDTPMPPPVNSLMDSPARGMNMMMQDEDMADQSVGMLGTASDASTSTWVTVYGFASDDLPAVLREFSKCGDIMEQGTYGASGRVNWTHICYSSTQAAQRALIRGGEEIVPGLLVGVKPLPAHMASQLLSGAGSGARLGSVGAAPYVASVRRVGGAYSAPVVLPMSQQSTWSKVAEFVLGW